MRAATRTWAAAAVALAMAVPLGLSACDSPAPRFSGPAASASAGSASPSPAASEPPLILAVTPATGARNLPISTEVGTTVTGGTISAVTLTETRAGSSGNGASAAGTSGSGGGSGSGGRQVAGQLREDGSAWVPASPLAYGRTYTASVTATSPGGQSQTRTTTFTTMRAAGGRRVGTGLYLFDGNTYGVAMPVVVEFDREIPAKSRAAVQRRLFVHSDPPQPGAWHWFGGRQVLYRPPAYWAPGTKLTVRSALAGLPVGNGRYGDTDRRASVTIGRKLEMKVDNKTKKMSVYEDGRLTRTMPVSLGKPSSPSSHGTMVVMDKQVQTVFDTYAELGPRDGYRMTISYAQRLTWGGQFIHSAPWSVADQGHRNVSHGCVNLAPDNAQWLFGRTMVGDPITVTGTERVLAPGDGWTAWDMSWADYIKGSALPVR